MGVSCKTIAVGDVEIHMLDTGHFALETHAVEIAGHIRDFLQRKRGL